MKKIFSIAAVAASLLLTGCFKDKYKIDVADNTNRLIVEFADAQNDINQINLDYATTLVDVSDVLLRANPRSVQDKDVTVKFILNPTLVADYNSANGTTYSPLPTNTYTIESNAVTIPASTRQAFIKLKVNPSLVMNGTYAIGFSISETSAGDISKTYKNVLYAISVKNKYDGYYQTKGAAYHPTYGNYVWNSNGVFACGNGFALVTSGLSSVDLDPGQPLQNGANLTFFSAVVPRFTVNPTTNKVTIASTIGTTVFVDYPAYDSRYDPATKTFYVKYGWSVDRVATDTFVYCGPR